MDEIIEEAVEVVDHFKDGVILGLITGVAGTITAKIGWDKILKPVYKNCKAKKSAKKQASEDILVETE